MDGLPECPIPGCGSTLVPPGETYCIDHADAQEDKDRERYYRTLETKKRWRQKNERAWRRRWRLKSRAYLMLALTYPPDSEERAELMEMFIDAKKTANGNHRGTNRKAQRKAAQSGECGLPTDNGSADGASNAGTIQQDSGAA